MSSKTSDLVNILNSALETARKEVEKDAGSSFFRSFDEEEAEEVNSIAKKASTQKGVLAVLITSLVKKIEDPSQNVRLHQSKMPGGYSGRSLDTKVVTPFIRRNFQKFSMKESGWLTRSLEQPVPFGLKYPGDIRNQKVKNAFLKIINAIEEEGADPRKYLVGLFILLEMQMKEIQTCIRRLGKVPPSIPIKSIVNKLEDHFNRTYHSFGASKLPVLAIYSLYQIMTKELNRFESKELLPLKSHVTADIKAGSLGDIEVVDELGEIFEVVEIKSRIQISYDMVNTIYEKKIKSSRVNRYYVLTSSKPYILKVDKQKLGRLITEIRKNHGCEIILNGLIPSIKYYLRLIGNTQDFLKKYGENLKQEIKKSSEIKKEHFEAWIQLLKEIEIQRGNLKTKRNREDRKDNSQLTSWA